MTAAASPAMHWAAAYIGLPWVNGESDCWHFARQVWHERFGWDVPAVEVDAASALAGRRAFRDGARADWCVAEEPEEGDAVLMATGERPCHVGIWVAADGGGVLHSVEGAGVIFTRGRRIMDIGYRVLGYYRRVAR